MAQKQEFRLFWSQASSVVHPYWPKTYSFRSIHYIHVLYTAKNKYTLRADSFVIFAKVSAKLKFVKVFFPNKSSFSKNHEKILTTKNTQNREFTRTEWFSSFFWTRDGAVAGKMSLRCPIWHQERLKNASKTAFTFFWCVDHHMIAMGNLSLSLWSDLIKWAPKYMVQK